jgi:hypothetical protein
MQQQENIDDDDAAADDDDAHNYDDPGLYVSPKTRRCRNQS